MSTIPRPPTSSASSRPSGARRRSTSSRAGHPLFETTPRILEGDVVDAVRRLKEQDGPDLGLGCGADLFATLSEAGLIDTYRFMVTPTAIGKGKALFASLKEPLRMRLTGTRTFSSGSVLLEYEPLR